MQKKRLLVFLAIFAIAVYGCAQQSLQNEKIVQTQQQVEQQQQEIQPPPECVGKKATDINLPQSCKNWFSRQISQGQPTQDSGNKCPDRVCDDFEVFFETEYAMSLPISVKTKMLPTFLTTPS
ncbi:MAG: hypothetical protein AABX33_00515 [Nanoarchaeota archaeon]